MLGFPGCCTSGCCGVNWESGCWGRERHSEQKDLLCREGGELGVDDLKWAGSCGNGCCMPWPPQMPQSRKVFFQVFFFPLNISQYC